MKNKSFKLVKELLLEQAQGAGAYIQEETDLAKELFCEIGGYDVERFDELHKGVIDTLNTSFPYGVGGVNGADWKTYRNTYAMLIDSIKYTLEQEEQEPEEEYDPPEWVKQMHEAASQFAGTLKDAFKLDGLLLQAEAAAGMQDGFPVNSALVEEETLILK